MWWEEWEEGLSGGEEWDELWAPASDVDLLLVSCMFSTISRVYKYWETQTTSCQFIGVTRVNRVNVPSPGAIPQVFIILACEYGTNPTLSSKVEFSVHSETLFIDDS